MAGTGSGKKINSHVDYFPNNPQLPLSQIEFVDKFPKGSGSLWVACRFAATQRQGIGNQRFPPKASGWNTLQQLWRLAALFVLGLGTTLEHTEARPVLITMQSSW